jgi:Fe-S-cluster containining protein
VNPLIALDALPGALLNAFQQRRDALYGEIDAAYAAAAAEFGFACAGCEDNCCLTRFHHHTLLELAAVREHFARLSPAERQAAERRAKAVIAEWKQAERQGRSPRAMCPLNADQRCRVYRSRPMICRMHGIPHVLRGPGRPPSYGPGCDAFVRRCGEQSGDRFDRTPLYRKMALLEQEIRRACGFSERINLTVAEMVMLFQRGEP